MGNTPAIARLGIPPLNLNDGPQGAALVCLDIGASPRSACASPFCQLLHARVAYCRVPLWRHDCLPFWPHGWRVLVATIHVRLGHCHGRGVLRQGKGVTASTHAVGVQVWVVAYAVDKCAFNFLHNISMRRLLSARSHSSAPVRVRGLTCNSVPACVSRACLKMGATSSTCPGR